MLTVLEILKICYIINYDNNEIPFVLKVSLVFVDFFAHVAFGILNYYCLTIDNVEFLVVKCKIYFQILKLIVYKCFSIRKIHVI